MHLFFWMIWMINLFQYLQKKCMKCIFLIFSRFDWNLILQLQTCVLNLCYQVSAEFSVIRVFFLSQRVSGYIPAASSPLPVCSSRLRHHKSMIRCLTFDHLFWLWFVQLTLLLRHPGVSHQLRGEEFTTHLKLSIRGGTHFPPLSFQLTVMELEQKALILWGMRLWGFPKEIQQTDL